MINLDVGILFDALSGHQRNPSGFVLPTVGPANSCDLRPRATFGQGNAEGMLRECRAPTGVAVTMAGSKIAPEWPCAASAPALPPNTACGSTRTRNERFRPAHWNSRWSAPRANADSARE